MAAGSFPDLDTDDRPADCILAGCIDRFAETVGTVYGAGVNQRSALAMVLSGDALLVSPVAALDFLLSLNKACRSKSYMLCLSVRHGACRIQ